MLSRMPQRSHSEDTRSFVANLHPFDPDELVLYAKRFGHPREWIKKVEELEDKADKPVVYEQWVCLIERGGKIIAWGDPVHTRTSAEANDRAALRGYRVVGMQRRFVSDWERIDAKKNY